MERDPLYNDPEKAKEPEPGTTHPGTPSNDAVLKELQAMRSQYTQLESGLTVVARALKSMNDSQQTQLATEEPSDSTDLSRSLLEDPRRFVSDEATRVVRDMLGPTERARAEETYQQNLEIERTRFDTQFGQGSFDEHIVPELDSTLEELGDNAVNVRAFRAPLTQLVNNIKGSKFESLAELSTKTKEAANKVATPPQAPGYMFGAPNMGEPPKKAQVQPQEQAYIDRTKVMDGEPWTNLNDYLEVRDALASGAALNEDGTGIDIDKARALYTEHGLGPGAKK